MSGDDASTGPAGAPHLRYGAASHVGQVRTVNQDNYIVAENYFVVADGMGGHQAGEIAAEMAVNTFDGAQVETVEQLVELVRTANEIIIDSSIEDADLRGMGTTVTSLALLPGDPPELVAANVGDSRIYVLRGGELEQVTHDHSLVGDMVRDGHLTPAEAETHPRRNVLTRALGIERDVDVDVFALPINVGERFVLCSDGLTGEVTDSGIAATLRRLIDPQEVAEDLVRQANENGGRDNITVVVVDLVDPDADPTVPLASMMAPPSRVDDTAEVFIGIDGPAAPTDTEPTPESAPPAADVGPITTTIDPAEPGPPRLPQSSGGTGFGLRAWLLVVGVLAVVLVAAWALLTAARGTYFAGLDDEQIVIYQGRPGGLLWFDPTIEERTPYTVGDVRAAAVPELEDGVERGSFDEALEYVMNLVAERAEMAEPSGPEASPPTTT
ncbi:MAG: Stp1/IreP family PP2C-type Ser/Thr phosphatase [Acidimicrobiales bacterium]|nr:Stp1/IreP family PP2C-type Ser/Thr phosphatase [Acidimicrobiales bacterium]